MSDIETTDVDMFTIGNNLRELREQKRVTQMQVVDVLGVSYTHYAKIEEGMRGMSLKMLIKLIRYFETDANTILGSAATAHALEIALWDEIDTKDPEQLRDRTLKYLQYCIDNNIKPGNLGLYNAWGLTKGEVSNIQRREPSSARTGVIKKSRQIMSQIREQLMSDGKINPVTGIFWQKKHLR